MLKHSFSDFSYAINTESEKKGQKEILVCFMYNGTEVLKKVYIPEKEGTAYIFEAKKIIEQEIRDGTLASYSHKFVRKNKKTNAKQNGGLTMSTKINGKKKLGIVIAVSAVAVVGVALGAFFLAKGMFTPAAVTEFKVINNEDPDASYTFEGKDKISKGKEYSCTVLPVAGSRIKSVYVYMNDVILSAKEGPADEDYDYEIIDNPGAGVNAKDIKISKHANGNINITVDTEAIPGETWYDVIFTGTDCSIDTKEKVKEGATNVVRVITPDNRDAINDKKIIKFTDIQMGGTPLVIDQDYTWNSTNNTLTINGPVNGIISIVAEAELYKETIPVTHNEVEDYCVFTGPDSIAREQDYNATINIKEEYAITKQAHILSINAGTTTIPHTDDDETGYTFNGTNLKIPGKFVTDDITINLAAKEKEREVYDVSFNSFGCESDGEATSQKGSKYSCNISLLYEYSDKVIDIMTVKVGEVLLTQRQSTEPAGNTYTFEDGVLTLDYETNADILINVFARDKEKVSGEPAFERIPDTDNAIITGLKDVTNEDLSKIEIVKIPSTVIDPDTGDPLTVTEIKNGALKGCSSIQVLEVPFVGTSVAAATEDNTNRFFGNIFGSELFEGVAGLTWQLYYDDEAEESAATHSQRYAIPFSLEQITVTGSQPIPSGAFSRCGYLTKVNFPNIVATKIPNYAFYECKHLNSIITNSDVFSEIEWRAFENCTNFRSLDFSQSTHTDIKIKHHAFAGCSGLVSVYLSSNVTELGEEAFTDISAGVIMCQYEQSAIPVGWNKNWAGVDMIVVYGVTEPTMGEIDSTGNFRFVVTTEGTSKYAYIVEYLGTPTPIDGTITIPKALTAKGVSYPVRHIGTSAFMGFQRIESYVLQCTSLKSIGNYAFAGNEMLTSIVGLGAAMTELTSIGNYAFAVNNKLTSFNLSSIPNLKVINEGIFYSCDKLVSAALPIGITSLGSSVFEECRSLKEIEINVSGITEVPYALFYCREPKDTEILTSPSLTGVSWKSDTDLTSIGGSSFGGCTALNNILFSINGKGTANQIPATVNNIGDYAFTRCTSFSSLSMPYPDSGAPSTYTMGVEVFKNWTADQYLYIASGWISGGGLFRPEATLVWGWKLSRSLLSATFHCTATGSSDLRIQQLGE